MEKINVMRILDQKKIKYIELKDLEKIINCKFDTIIKE